MRRIAWDDPSLAAVHDLLCPPKHTAVLCATRWPGMNTGGGMWTTRSWPCTTTPADEPQGYLVYLLKREIFKIKEMVYLNDEARRGMWDYVTAHYSMVTEVSG